MQAPNDLALEGIKEITTNLLYLSVGVFALVGGFLTSAKKDLAGRRTLLISLGSFGVSVFLGGLILMDLISALVAQKFDPTDTILRLLSAIQIISAGLGCVLFFIYLWMNLWKKEG